MIQPQPTLTYAATIIKLLKGVMYSDDSDWNLLQRDLTDVKNYFSKIGLQVHNYETEGFAYLEQPDPDPDDHTKQTVTAFNRSS